MTDARSHYYYNRYVYVGKNSEGFGLNAELKKHLNPTQSVLRLVMPIESSNHNVIADLFGTSSAANKSRTHLCGNFKEVKKGNSSRIFAKKKSERMGRYLVLRKT